MGIVQALNYIPKTIQKLAWGCVKAPGFDDRKSVHISNIDRLAIVEPRELSRSPRPTFESFSVYTKMEYTR